MLWISALAFFLAFTSILYQQSVAKTIAEITDYPLVWESLTLGFFLLGMAIGSLSYHKLIKPKPLAFLSQIQFLYAIVGGLSVPFLLGIHLFYRIYILDQQMLEFLNITLLDLVMLSCQVVPLLLGILSGIEFLLLLELGAPKSLPWIFGIYYLGSCFAGVLFSFVLGRTFPITLTLYIAFTNIILSMFLINHSSVMPPTKRNGSVLAHLGGKLGFGLFLLTILFYSSSLFQLYLKNFYYNQISIHTQRDKVVGKFPISLFQFLQIANLFPEVLHIKTPYQTIDLVYRVERSWEIGKMQVHANYKDFTLFINQHLQFATKLEKSYHEFMTHLPLMLFRNHPKNVLILGGGDGLIARELLKYPDLQITQVELDVEMVRLANSSPIVELNEGSLQNPRVQLLLEDAMMYLKTHTGLSFDAVFVDLPYPFNEDGLRIYSKEFFSLLSRALSPSGFFVLDVPLDFKGEYNPWKNFHILATLRASGFSFLFPYVDSLGETFVCGARSEENFHFSFIPPPTDLVYLTPSWFEWGDKFYNQLHLTNSDKVNSLLLPRRFILRDLRL